jgi:hypothetical protein
MMEDVWNPITFHNITSGMALLQAEKQNTSNLQM